MAKIEGAGEIAMGAPTCGVLRVSNGIEVEECNPSFVWSDDSQYIAIPHWTPNRKQKIMVIDVAKKKVYLASGVYRVLELYEFINGIIRGIDSPIYEPCKINISVEDVVSNT
ncbi:hypothetical protein [Sulfurovum sp.]|uniref:hypothetical protein n=1 Tax=Sulfurovum sp. TaxID=1969726 RepID=UPI0035616E69